MSVSAKTFVLHCALLVDDSTNDRYTEMRAWQLIVDSWLAGEGTQPPGTSEGLQYLVFCGVVESQSCIAMREELHRQSCQDPVEREWAKPVEFMSASRTWKETPFIRCAERVATALSTATREIKASRAWILYKSMDVGEVDFHLVVELTPVTDSAVTPSTRA